jgi:hypothetical protein
MLVLFLVAASAGVCPPPDPPADADPSIVAIEKQIQEEDAKLAPPPAGFDCQVWNRLSRDQKIDLSVSASDSPHAITSDTKAAVIAAIKSKLKDPDSAEFRDIKRRGALDYCGWVNAKNSLGGYVGYSVFFANAKWTLILNADESEPDFCK